jgi:hypothetical protein
MAAMGQSPEVEEGDVQREVVTYLLYEPLKRQFLFSLECGKNPDSSIYRHISIPEEEKNKETEPLMVVAKKIKKERKVEPIDIVKSSTFVELLPNGELVRFHSYLILAWKGKIEANDKKQENVSPVAWVDYDTAMDWLKYEISKKILTLAQNVIKAKEEQKVG